jgi:hypothetical protein
MTSTTHRRAEATLTVLVALVYAWFASSVKSFSVPAYVLIAVPSLIALLLYGVLGGFSTSRGDVTNYYRTRSATTSWRRAAPWIVVAVLAVALESVGLALGGRSIDVPTLSTTVDHLLVDHWGRFLLFALWLAVGANPLRLLHLSRQTRHE